MLWQTEEYLVEPLDGDGVAVGPEPMRMDRDDSHHKGKSKGKKKGEKGSLCVCQGCKGKSLMSSKIIWRKCLS